MNGGSSELVLTNKKENNDPSISLVATLGYLSNILLEENIDEEEEVSFKEETALHAMEKYFADIISQKNPTSTNEQLQEQINSILQSIPAVEYNKGVEEGLRFLPSMQKLMIDFQGKKFSFPSPSPHGSTEEENEDLGCVVKGSNGKNKLENRNSDLPEGRNCKIPLAYSEEPVRDAKLDEVILYYDDYFKKVARVRETMQASTSNEKKEVVQEQYIDLKDLLISCSNSISTIDHQTAEDFIKKIRKQAFPDGDGNERFALVLADALEARLTGTGTEMYNQSVAKRISTSDIVKVQYLFMTITPFLRCTYFTAFDTILRSLEKASKLHIVDFGIDFGFQWPSLIQELSDRKMDVKLKITGIDFPRSGFRPTERVDETGRRLKEYAKSFNVPFEYHGIASKWDEIRMEDLKIEKDEVLIVNSMYQFRQLADETVALDSPRDKVLNFIRQLKPRLFLLGVINGTFSPFFVTRFRQVMLHYAPMFDILDAFVPRDNKVRHLIERDMLAKEVINLIACEGPSCVERPETYKQWHLRNLRAGFEQVPLDPYVLETSKRKYKTIHDKRYFVEEESNWLLQGWRGKTLRAISCWRPKQEAA